MTTVAPAFDNKGVHQRHCYQGEYYDSCKYGEFTCPMRSRIDEAEEWGRKYEAFRLVRYIREQNWTAEDILSYVDNYFGVEGEEENLKTCPDCGGSTIRYDKKLDKVAPDGQIYVKICATCKGSGVIK